MIKWAYDEQHVVEEEGQHELQALRGLVHKPPANTMCGFLLLHCADSLLYRATCYLVCYNAVYCVGIVWRSIMLFVVRRGITRQS